MKRARFVLLLYGATLVCANLDTLFQRPTFSFLRMDIAELSFTGAAVMFHFAVDNPNPVGIDLARLAYQLTIDGHALAEGEGAQALHLPGNGTGELALPVSIRYLDFAQSIAALI